MVSQYKTLFKVLSRYLRDYGGLNSIVQSPFTGAALLALIFTFDRVNDKSWPILAQSLLPNLLGFSLGTYALLFSLMSGRIKLALSKLRNERGVSFLKEVNATFFHFIFVQISAILLSFLYQSTFIYKILIWQNFRAPEDLPIFKIGTILFGSFGLFLFYYSLVLVVASSLAVYRIAGLVDPRPPD